MRLLPLVSLIAFSSLGSCATYPGDAPIVENGPPAPQGTLVAIGQPVAVGPVVATPMQVAEDVRCPIDAACIWAGRIVVTTRIDGPGWRETVDLESGKQSAVRGATVTLAQTTPAKTAEADIAPADYRFLYTTGD